MGQIIKPAKGKLPAIMYSTVWVSCLDRLLQLVHYICRCDVILEWMETPPG